MVTSPKAQKIPFKGRKISLEEVKFIFDRIWHANLKSSEHEEDLEHVKEKNIDQSIVMLEDLFHCVELTGQLLNKLDPDGNESKPFDEFMKFAGQTTIDDSDGAHMIQFVEACDMPKVLFRIFAGQPDAQRTDAAHLIAELQGPEGHEQLP